MNGINKITMFTALKKYAVFSGRASRKEYWLFMLLWFIGFVVAGIFNLVVSLLIPFIGFIIGMIVLMLFFLGLALPLLGVTVRRLHDIGKSGWWIFSLLIPCAGPFILFFFMFKASEVADNRFGVNPHTYSF